MKTTILFRRMVLGSCVALALCVGCDKQEATTALKNAEESAKEAADTVATDVSEAVKEGGKMAGDALEEGKQAASEAVKKGSEMAGELGEKAMAYLTPLKEKFSDLDSLKEKPEELKSAVDELIQTIETKAEDIELPESVTNALATVKEKLVALKDYLAGEVEQAKIDEHLKEIMESVKSSFGMSDQ